MTSEEVNNYLAKLAYECRIELAEKRTRCGGEIDNIKDESIIEWYVLQAFLAGCLEGENA